MGRHGEENGNARRSRLAYERLRDHVQSLPPRSITRANGLVLRIELWVYRYANDLIEEYGIRGIPREDVHQSAFLGAVKASYSWTPAKGAFTYWAWYWMRKEVQNLLNETGPALYPLFGDDRGNDVVADPRASGGSEAEAADYAAKMRAEVGRLPEAYRAVVEDWAEGVALSRTAARLGYSGRHVKTLRASAMAWLRHRMGEGPEPDRGMIVPGRRDEPPVHLNGEDRA